MVKIENPDILISCGDWGVQADDRSAFETFVKAVKIPVISIYGNHDDITQIKRLKVRNYTWLPSFIVKTIKGLRFMGINGNIAKKPRFPWHTSEKNIREELRLCNVKPGIISFIVSHECPLGYADVIKSREKDKTGRHKWKKNVGFPSLFEVLDKFKPKYFLCGHIHFQQISQYKNTMLFNVGYGPRGQYILLDTLRKYSGKEWLNVMRKVES